MAVQWHPILAQFLSTLHIKAFREVLSEMNIENLRELDLDQEAMADLFGILARGTGPEIAIEAIGIQKVIEAIGIERILQSVELDRLEEFVKKAKSKNNQQTVVS